MQDEATSNAAATTQAQVAFADQVQLVASQVAATARTLNDATQAAADLARLSGTLPTYTYVYLYVYDVHTYIYIYVYIDIYMYTYTCNLYILLQRGLEETRHEKIAVMEIPGIEKIQVFLRMKCSKRHLERSIRDSEFLYDFDSFHQELKNALY